MSRDEDRPEITPQQHAMVAADIKRLIQNPPLRREVDPAKRWPESEQASLIGGKALQQLRELACKRTGMTMEQLLEAEAAVSHPREFVPLTPSPKQVARGRLKDALVPEKYIRSVVDADPLNCFAMGKVRGFLDSKLGFLMLSGGKGTYKSGSTCWALGQVDGGAYVEAMDLVDVSLNHPVRWKRLLEAPMVVLDDLGVELRKGGATDVFMGAFHKLYNGAYSGCRRLLLTSNITKAQFRAEPTEGGGYGERAADRFREVGDWWDVPGESVRQSMGRTARHWQDDREPGEEG